MQKLSIIVSVYNEEDSLLPFYTQLEQELKTFPVDAEILFVNDGSSDNSLAVLHQLRERDSRVRIISFSRNFGHEAAMLAGIDHCSGDAAICMDADLQHPPACIHAMWEKYLEGFEIINMVRTDRDDGGWFRSITSRFFYSITNKMMRAKLEPNASDFFLISRRVIHILQNQYRERTRFI